MAKKFALAALFLIEALWPQDALAAISIVDVTPSMIDSSDQVISISASASGLSQKKQYLQVVFTKEGQAANYFGYTRDHSGGWYKYKSSPTDSDLTSFFGFMPSSGSWSGKLEAKIDMDDSGFTGPGNYLLKLAKYISSSAVYSDAKMIQIKATKPETPKVQESKKEVVPAPKETFEAATVTETPIVAELADVAEVPEGIIAEEPSNYTEVLGTEAGRIVTVSAKVVPESIATPSQPVRVAARASPIGWGIAGLGTILLGIAGGFLYNRYRRSR